MVTAANDETAVMLDHLIEQFDIKRLILYFSRNHIHIESTIAAAICIVVLVTVIQFEKLQHLWGKDWADQCWLLKGFTSSKSLKEILQFTCINMH